MRLVLVLVMVTGCADDPLAGLEPDTRVALEAALEGVAGYQDLLPVEEDVLAREAMEDLRRGEAWEACTRVGVYGGAWLLDGPAFEGTWYRVATAELGGTAAGDCTGTACTGVLEGPNQSGTLDAAHGGGLFIGDWVVADGEGRVQEGQLVGAFQERSDAGGYLFGLWGRCDLEVGG